jgi:hypothetical protein
MADIVWQNRKHAGPGSPDIVWQYLYHMKLVSLIEDDTQDLNPEQTPEIQTYNRIIELVDKLKDEFGFYTKQLDYPDGKFEMRMWTKLDPGQHLADSYGTLSLNIYFLPNIDNPTLPTDLIRRPMDVFIKTIKELEPKVMEDDDLYTLVRELNKLEIKISDLYLKFGRALYNFNELIPRADFNTKVRGFSEPLGKLLRNPGATDQLMFATGELPTFDPHFKNVHDKLIKKTSTIVKAYQKGKWKGHTYDIGLIDGKINSILLLDNNKGPIVKDGVIQVSLTPHLSMHSPIIDGKNRYYKDEYPLSDDELTEFNKYMDKVFAKYGIKYI